MTLRLVLLDDHHLVRQGLVAVLTRFENLTVVGEATDAHQAYEIVASAGPCLVVLDVALPGSDAIAVTRELLSREPRCRVFILTMHVEHDRVLQAFAAGAHGYAVKDQHVDGIIEAIRAVGRGERYLAPRLPRSLLDEAARRGTTTRSPEWLDPLSPRQRQILNLVVRGFTSVNIAAELSIRGKTIESHRGSIQGLAGYGRGLRSRKS